MDPPNTGSPTSEQAQLSRAVSAVDLNASLTAVKEQPDKVSRQTQETSTNTQPNPLTSTEKPEVSTPCGDSTPPVVPYPPPPTPATFNNDETTEPTTNDEPAANSAEENNLEVDAQEKKKKKKKRSGKKKSEKPKKLPVTGFEEYFADAPIRPDEYAEELDLYDQNRDFKDRMQSCIQRYRACRKLEQVRSNVFTKYLALGGVETGVKQFTGGLDKETLENSTAKEIAAIQATDYIRAYPHSSKYYDGSENWVVDFEGVAKGFFSHKLAASFPINDEEQLQTYCEVIKNFLKYVLYHKVCPEYTANIIAACKIADMAKKELWSIQKIASILPSDFNVAASIIFGGRYANVWQSEFREDENADDENITALRFSQARAELIFMAAITISGGEEYLARMKNSELSIIKTEKNPYEVVEIHHPDHLTIKKYRNVTDNKGRTGIVKHLGIIKLKLWMNPELEEEEDFTDDESNRIDCEPELESFWLEEEILQHLYVGLKLELIVKELNIGLKFIDTFSNLYCSFYTYLPNEKMSGFKEPMPSNRPPITEDDIDNFDQEIVPCDDD